MNRIIFALATPYAISPVAIIRISGDNCNIVLSRIIPELSSVEPRRIKRSYLYSVNGELIDEVMVATFKSPKSFTGEDMVEIFCHGNPIIISKIMQTLRDLGLQDALPGEFSKRAFLNSKMDLAQAEGLAAMIEARSEEALRISQSSYFGRLSQELHAIKKEILEALAITEAHLDFVEEDVGNFDINFVLERVDRAMMIADRLVSGYTHARFALNGVKISIVGKPNAGKSSLMNLILGKERSIVTEVPGTTRDYVEDRMALDGFELIVRDLAGFRETEDIIEQKGIELGYKILEESDLCFVVHDITKAREDLDELVNQLPQNKPKWLILNKIDLLTNVQNVPRTFETSNRGFERVLMISAIDPSYRNVILKELTSFITSSRPSLDTAVTNERQHNIILKFNHILEDFKKSVHSQPLDIQAELLREALKCLDEFTGRTYPDDILGEIFSRFCIGK